MSKINILDFCISNNISDQKNIYNNILSNMNKHKRYW